MPHGILLCFYADSVSAECQELLVGAAAKVSLGGIENAPFVREGNQVAQSSPKLQNSDRQTGGVCDDQRRRNDDKKTFDNSSNKGVVWGGGGW